MAKKLCPICRTHTFNFFTAMVCKDGCICGECLKEFESAKSGELLKDYTVAEVATIINSSNYDPSINFQNEASLTNPNQNSNDSFFERMKALALKQKQDYAISKAYKIEEEKRKPQKEIIKHTRELTEQEQHTIDMIDIEIAKVKGKQLDDMNKGIKTPMYSHELANLHRKKEEIKQRCVTYEEIIHPPIIDPNEPIVVDEEKIRNSIKSIL